MGIWWAKANRRHHHQQSRGARRGSVHDGEGDGGWWTAATLHTAARTSKATSKNASSGTAARWLRWRRLDSSTSFHTLLLARGTAMTT